MANVKASSIKIISRIKILSRNIFSAEAVANFPTKLTNLD
jgi:hypothetical protein